MHIYGDIDWFGSKVLTVYKAQFPFKHTQRTQGLAKNKSTQAQVTQLTQAVLAGPRKPFFQQVKNHLFHGRSKTQSKTKVLNQTFGKVLDQSLIWTRS